MTACAKPLLIETQQLLQLIDYIGTDYSYTVVEGQVANLLERASKAAFITVDKTERVGNEGPKTNSKYAQAHH